MNKYLMLALASGSLLHAMEKELYRPVVLVHGIFSDAQATLPFKQKLEQALPGIYVKTFSFKDCGLQNPYKQIAQLQQEIMEDPNLKGKQINLVSHSQGTLIARGYIEMARRRLYSTNEDKKPVAKSDDPKVPLLVHNYIAMGGPQAGEYGFPHDLEERLEHIINEGGISWAQKILRKIVCGLLKLAIDKGVEHADALFYTKLFQRKLSFPGYWKDPLEFEQYIEDCRYLPYLNNEFPHELAKRYRKNLADLSTMVLVKSINDIVIEPQESSWFGFYKPGYDEDLNVENFDQRFTSENDPLGLYALKESGKLKFIQATCEHTEFWDDDAVFTSVLPFLSEPVDAESGVIKHKADIVDTSVAHNTDKKCGVFDSCNIV